MDHVSVGGLVSCPACGGGTTLVVFAPGREPVLLCAQCCRGWKLLMSAGKEVKGAVRAPYPTDSN